MYVLIKMNAARLKKANIPKLKVPPRLFKIHGKN
jgi:hypothetical protein